MEAYCIGCRNETYERFVFNTRCQNPDESVDSYITALHELAKSCNFDTLYDSLLRDRLVLGVKNKTIRKKLLATRDLTLDKAITIAQALELTETQLNSVSKLEGTSQPPEHVCAVNQSRTQRKPCRYCATRHRPKKELCPAWGKTCNKCKKRNHFAVCCEPTQAVHAMTEASSDDDYDSIYSLNTSPKRKVFANMIIAKQRNIRFQLDLGATLNTLPIDVYKSLHNPPPLEKFTTALELYNKTHDEPPAGQIICKTINPKDGGKYKVRYAIVAKGRQPILGSQAIQHMKLVTVNSENILSMQTQNGLLHNYSDIFDHEQGRMPGKVQLTVDKSVVPVKQPARKVPLAMRDRVRDHIDELVKGGILAPVTTPTDWISGVVVVTKPNGKIRLCIDPKPLNNALQRSHYPLATLDDLLPELSNAKFFTVADTKNGYWHCQLDDKSSMLTTCATPFGRYRWLCLPYGLAPSGEEFQRKLNECLDGLAGVKAIADDILVWGSTEAEHDERVQALFERCRRSGIKLNRDKLKLKQTNVKYMGHILTDKGILADPAKIEAIQLMPRPTDKTAVKRLLGTCNYLQQFAPQLSEVTTPLRNLLKTDVEFIWDDPQEQAFTQVKELLSSPPVLRYFDQTQQLTLQCDASQNGLGVALMQQGQPIAMASRSLSPAEQLYAQIEKELLAVVFGMERFRQYTYGRKIMVESDHRPLAFINKKSLVSAPKRLQRMLLRLQEYEYDIVYKPGSALYLADTLSRAQLQTCGVSDVDREVESIHMIDYVVNISRDGLDNIRQATKADGQMNTLKSVIEAGWPDTCNSLDTDTKAYYPFRDELTIQDGLVFKGDRVVVPQELRSDIIKRVHSSHLGEQSCLRRAREAVYWPHMNDDIIAYISRCSVCRSFGPAQQREPLISHDIGNGPWQKVGVDLFQCDQFDYMVTVDYYSGFFEVDRLTVNKKATEIITKLKCHFMRHGIPLQLMSDNGPPFNSQKFREFSKSYEFEHLTSSPHYPQSNGKAESAVKIASSIIRKAHRAQQDVHLALLDYYNTPTEGMGSSPAQRLFSRRTRTLLPTAGRLLDPEVVPDVKPKKLTKTARSQQNYNKATKEMPPPLYSGDTVRIYDQGWRPAKVVAQNDIRSYSVETGDGRMYRRNRRHLRKTNESFERQIPEDVTETLESDNSAPDCSPTPVVDSRVDLAPARHSVRPTRSRVSTKDTLYKDFVMDKSHGHYLYPCIYYLISLV